MSITYAKIQVVPTHELCDFSSLWNLWSRNLEHGKRQIIWTFLFDCEKVKEVALNTGSLFGKQEANLAARI